MATVKPPPPTQDSLIFNSPEQRVLKLLLSQPTTAFQPRVMSSKLKGVRGLGGVEGILKILADLEHMGMVHFLDNRRAVRINDDHPTVKILKILLALCDLEGLKNQLSALTSRVVLYGSRAAGHARSDSDYNILVVSDNEAEVTRITQGHPLSKELETKVVTADEFNEFEKKEKDLAGQVKKGIILWG